MYAAVIDVIENRNYYVAVSRFDNSLKWLVFQRGDKEFRLGLRLGSEYV